MINREERLVAENKEKELKAIYPQSIIKLSEALVEIVNAERKAAKQQERAKCLKIIDEDIKIQKTFLENNFEKDKPIHWRITGMTSIKIKINKE